MCKEFTTKQKKNVAHQSETNTLHLTWKHSSLEQHESQIKRETALFFKVKY